MSKLYLIEVAGKIVYACSDPLRFVREASKVAAVENATLVLADGK